MNDIHNHINTLRSLLPDLRAANIKAIEFGEEEHPLGFMSHHRIQIINTPGGPQFCFKMVMRGMLGGGDYIGQPDDRDIEVKAQSLLERYFAPTPFDAAIKKHMNTSKLRQSNLKYFAIQFEE